MPQAVVDVRQGERDEHLADDLRGPGAERLRRLDVAVRHVHDGGNRVRIHERHARDEDEHHLLGLVDPEPENGQRDQRGHRQIAAEQGERRAGGLDDAPGSCDDAERNTDERGETEPDEDAPKRRGNALKERAFAQQARKAPNHFGRTRQDDRRHEPILRAGAERRDPPEQHDDSNGPGADETPGRPGRRDAQCE